MLCRVLTLRICFLFFFKDTATTEIYTLSLHDALPIFIGVGMYAASLAHHQLVARLGLALIIGGAAGNLLDRVVRSEEHTSELQSQFHLVCRLLLEKKKTNKRCPDADNKL